MRGPSPPATQSPAPPVGDAPLPRPWYLQPTKVILSAGALAGAIGSILTFGGMVRSVFEDGPQGSVELLKIQDLTPLSYGGWITHEGGNQDRVPPTQAELPGRLITYAVETEGFAENTTLPVRIILHDLTTGKVVATHEDPIRTRRGATCGCSDWVLVPDPDHRYRLELQIYPPGEIDGSPERLDFREFRGS